MNLDFFYKKYPLKKDCIEFLENIKWNNHPFCPYCESDKYSETKNSHRYHCNICNSSYSVTVGTLMHKTKIDLQKWFYAINFILNSTEQISSRMLADKINTTKDTAWRLMNKIKNAVVLQDELVYKISKHE